MEAERESPRPPVVESQNDAESRTKDHAVPSDIPFNKLVLGQSNVRRVKAFGVSIEQLAESIAQRTLLQGLSVRAVVDADGNETGMFEVPRAAGAIAPSSSW